MDGFLAVPESLGPQTIEAQCRRREGEDERLIRGAADPARLVDRKLLQGVDLGDYRPLGRPSVVAPLEFVVKLFRRQVGDVANECMPVGVLIGGKKRTALLRPRQKDPPREVTLEGEKRVDAPAAIDR